MDTDFLFGTLQFGTELHVIYYLRKWRPVISSMVDEIQNLLVRAGIRPCVKHNSCLFSVSETDCEPHIYFGAFSHFVLFLVTHSFFEKAED